jgi:hypothetical protein
MERIEIRPPAWKMGLLVLGIIAFTLFGCFIMMSGEGLAEQALGLITVVFFGGFGSYALYLRSRGQETLAILPTGIEIGLPGVTPVLLPWSDIEAFGVTTIVNQEFTTITLKSAQRWLSAISPEEAAAAVRFFRRLGLVGEATVKVMVANEEDDLEELQQTLAGSKEVKSLSDILAYNRTKFGGDFLLGWPLRDRGAQAFADFLEERRRSGSQ